jgi:hypothetical protein
VGAVIKKEDATTDDALRIIAIATVAGIGLINEVIDLPLRGQRWLCVSGDIHCHPRTRLPI